MPRAATKRKKRPDVVAPSPAVRRALRENAKLRKKVVGEVRRRRALKKLIVNTSVKIVEKRPKAGDLLQKAAAEMQVKATLRDQPEGERSMGKTIKAFNALTGHSISERDGWLFMVCLKMARAATTANGVEDDYVDGAAYFALAGESAR